MSDDVWEPNAAWKKLPEPAEGDIVHLKHGSVFTHLVKVIVSSVDTDTVTGSVEMVFDWETKVHIIAGEILCLVGKEVTFKRNLLQNVIKKPGHSK